MNRKVVSCFLFSGFLLAGETKPALQTYSGVGVSRTVHYGHNDVIEVNTRQRWTTEIVLPEGEKILDFFTGDKENWVISHEEEVNFLTVKPTLQGITTNLILVSASGNHYRFVLHESESATPDMAVTLELNEENMRQAVKSKPKYVSAETLGRYERLAHDAQLELASERTKTAQTTQAEKDSLRAQYPGLIDDHYKFERNRRPFYVTSVFNDGKFTYIRCHPDEVPAVYEVKDGKPSLIEVGFNRETFTVPKIVRNGYLAVGRQKLQFDYLDK